MGQWRAVNRTGWAFLEDWLDQEDFILLATPTGKITQSQETRCRFLETPSQEKGVPLV